MVVKLNQLQRIAGFAFAALGARALTDSFDQLVNLQNRLKAVTNSTQEFEAAQQGVVDVARKAFTPIEDVAALFQRYTQVTDHLGVSQDQVLGFTESLIKAGKLSGASVAELRGSLIQLGQGLGNNFKSGGQELNSILEQTPEIAKIIAEHIGVDKGKLKEAAKAGKITAEAVFEAFRARSEDLNKRFAKRKLSFEDVKVRAGVEWMVLMEKLAPAISKVVDKLMEFVNEMQHWVESGAAVSDVMAGLITVVGVLSVAFAGLAVQVLKTALPLLALFLVVEDFVTFMRGGDSLIGRGIEKMFGTGAADKFRETIEDIVDIVGDLIKAFFGGDEEALQHLGDRLEIIISLALERAWDAFVKYAYANMGPLAWLIRTTTAENDTPIQDKSMLQLTPGELPGEMFNRAKESFASLFDGTDSKFGNQMKAGDDGQYSGLSWDKVGSFLSGSAEGRDSVSGLFGGISDEDSSFLQGVKNRASMFGNRPDIELAPTPWSPVGSGGGAAPQITNTITVQGNATPAVAREIADRTGTATAASLGRDRSAIGASVGAP